VLVPILFKLELHLYSAGSRCEYGFQSITLPESGVCKRTKSTHAS